tara:strand:+ start:1208 stop:1429 length:222 start_codon:yes stop_codon:yes gene_type:complete
MTSKEFVAFLKGMVIGIENTPNKEQWAIILKKLMKIREEGEVSTIVTEIKEEVEKIIKPIIKKFPGSPPDIFM